MCVGVVFGSPLAVALPYRLTRGRGGGNGNDGGRCRVWVLVLGRQELCVFGVALAPPAVAPPDWGFSSVSDALGG